MSEMTTDTEIDVTEKQELESESEQTRPGPVFVPPVDIFEDPTGITVVADVPGAASDGVEIDLDNGALTIAAAVADPHADGETDLVREWTSGRFYRRFNLSDQIDQDGIEAQLHDGVLRIHLPKVAKAQPRRIQVSTG